MGFVMCHMECALCDTTPTRRGAITKLCPMSFTILWATCLIAGHLLDLAMSVKAFLSTVLGGDIDGECTRADSNRAIIATIGTVLVAFAPFAPRSFAIDGAWVLSTNLVLDVGIVMFAFATSKLRWCTNYELTRLAPTTTG